MRKLFFILLCWGLPFQIFAQKTTDFNLVDKIEMYYLNDLIYFELEYQTDETKITVDPYAVDSSSFTLPDSITVELLQLVKASFFDGTPTQGKNSDDITSDEPVVGVTCYAKGKKVYTNRICHEIDYRYSPSYTQLINRLLSVIERYRGK